jgi:septal ring factor EnvC (AmiA/AmiB activator)
LKTKISPLLSCLAATAASDLNAARKIKQFRTELEETKAIEAELRRKLDEAKTTSQSIQSTFAGIVNEKEKLIQENNELQAVCEDLMAEIEGQPGK